MVISEEAVSLFVKQTEQGPSLWHSWSWHGECQALNRIKIGNKINKVLPQQQHCPHVTVLSTCKCTLKHGLGVCNIYATAGDLSVCMRNNLLNMSFHEVPNAWFGTEHQCFASDLLQLHLGEFNNNKKIIVFCLTALITRIVIFLADLHQAPQCLQLCASEGACMVCIIHVSMC